LNKTFSLEKTIGLLDPFLLEKTFVDILPIRIPLCSGSLLELRPISESLQQDGPKERTFKPLKVSPN
jgi:hypothetical protein